MPNRTRTHRVHRTDIQLRFGDTDALGHVNNASFAVYAETARLEFLRTLGEAVRSLILAHLAMDFRRQVELEDRVHVDTWVERIGNSSLTLLQHILANDLVAAEVRSVVVCFDYETQRPRPWPDAVRHALQPYVQPERVAEG